MAQGFQLLGSDVVPHVATEGMKFNHSLAEKSDGALVRLFVQATMNAPGPKRQDFRGNGAEPGRLVAGQAWYWCDFTGEETDAGIPIPPGALTVLTFNTAGKEWAVGKSFRLKAAGSPDAETIPLQTAPAFISSLSFPASGEARGDLRPDTVVFHVVNGAKSPLRLVSVRVWLPRDPALPRFLYPGPVLPLRETFPEKGVIAPGDQGGARVKIGATPCTFCAIEIQAEAERGRKVTLWASQKIRPAVFDISGGWISEGVTADIKAGDGQARYLRTLHRFQINTGHFVEIPGFTDGPLYKRFPLKRFGGLEPAGKYSGATMLPFVHGIEWLGEPQYNDDKPVTPVQEIFRRLDKRMTETIPTTVTLSDASFWHRYAGIADFPHFDAYRVTAPAADEWTLYERWDGKRIGWGAPLETMGAMCRSLRALNRPAPVAAWTQGPHDWEVYDKRARTTPTPDELRVQAHHALASGVHSLYWFNLSLKSLLLWRDTMAELERVGLEARLLAPFLTTGDLSHVARMTAKGRPDWDLSVISSPDAAVCFALDAAYAPDFTQRVFTFSPPRPAKFAFPLPGYLRNPKDIFRLDADGVYPVSARAARDGITIDDKASRSAIYIAARSPRLRETMEKQRNALRAANVALLFDPARNDADFAALQQLTP